MNDILWKSIKFLAGSMLFFWLFVAFAFSLGLFVVLLANIERF